MSNIKEFILELRNNLGITQEQLANLIDIKNTKKNFIDEWEKGVALPSSARLKKLKDLSQPKPFKQKNDVKYPFTFVDLFAGIGGIRLPFQQRNGQCIFSSEIDIHARKTYFANFGDYPAGDITKISAKDIPEHDILLAGFPCQAFSQAGLQRGFNDTRGTMFFEIQRILNEKKPKVFLLENVKRLTTHDKGRTFKVMRDILTGVYEDTISDNLSLTEETKQALSNKLNYWIDFKVLRAADFGVPQNRERIYIVGFNKDYFKNIKDFSSIFSFPEPTYTPTKVGDILEDIPKDDTTYTISEKIWIGHQKRKELHAKKGNGFGFSLVNKNSKYTNTISARYYKDGSEALVEQAEFSKPPRMLTERECARLQGFPEQYIVHAVSKGKMYQQFGNSVCIKVVDAIADKLLSALKIAENVK